MFVNLLKRFKWSLIIAALFSGVSAFSGIAMLTIISEVIASFKELNGIPKYSFLIFALASFMVISTNIIAQNILLRLSGKVLKEIRLSLIRGFKSEVHQNLCSECCLIFMH
ncbi:hypothetical protein [Marinicellulosiphila megalodicopiae]|uniref:hypothetical protein n=1 Tax=Marinicellulosiphila megalodicopiae TaxID=2724896 RepID=UPI003BAE623A